MIPTDQANLFIHAEIAYNTKMLTVFGTVCGVLLTGMIGLLAANPANFSYPLITIDGIALLVIGRICLHFHNELRHFINQLRNPQ